MNGARLVCYLGALGFILLGFSGFLVKASMKSDAQLGAVKLATGMVVIGVLWLLALWSKSPPNRGCKQ